MVNLKFANPSVTSYQGPAIRFFYELITWNEVSVFGYPIQTLFSYHP